MVDWIADYRASLADHPVRSQVAPGWVKSQLSAKPPAQPEPLAAIVADLDRVVVPGMTLWQHPSFFAWFPANASLSSVLGDLVAGGLGGLGLSWEAGPALTEMEEVVCGWFGDFLDLKAPWKGSIQDTASTGCFLAMLAARSEAASAPEIVIYCGETANTSVQRAAMAAGVTAERLRYVPTRADHSLDPAALRGLIELDAAAGLCPAAIVATVGTTGTTAVDPIPELAAIAAEFDLWLHVDAAMAGAAAMLPEFAPMFEGVAEADSISVNPHKWLGTVFDCSLLYVRDPRRLTSMMAVDATYIRDPNATADPEAITQYRDWGIPLGRKFRAMKMWMQFRLDGTEAIRARLRRDVENARWLAAKAEAADGWDVVAAVNLQTVCLRHMPRESVRSQPAFSFDDYTTAWVKQLNDSGRALVTQDLLDGQAMVRVSIGAEQTERVHVERLWSDLQAVVDG